MPYTCYRGNCDHSANASLHFLPAAAILRLNKLPHFGHVKVHWLPHCLPAADRQDVSPKVTDSAPWRVCLTSRTNEQPGTTSSADSCRTEAQRGNCHRYDHPSAPRISSCHSATNFRHVPVSVGSRLTFPTEVNVKAQQLPILRAACSRRTRDSTCCIASAVLKLFVAQRTPVDFAHRPPMPASFSLLCRRKLQP